MVDLASYVASASSAALAFQNLVYKTNAVVSSSDADNAWVVVALVSLIVDILTGEDCSCYRVNLSVIQWVKCVDKVSLKDYKNVNSMTFSSIDYFTIFS